ncbi:MAG: rubrerythrin family protein [Haloarculaceae archaeon]
MDGPAFVEAVEDETATELGRLGSDKYLIAATGADLSASPVLESVARTAADGRAAFESWADDADGATAEAFAAAAETEREHYERVAAELDGEPETEPEDPLGDALASASGTPARAGALVGRGLVCDRTRLQVVNFFVNEADERRADLARDLRADANDQVEAGAALLETVCEGDQDWEAARDAAETVVDAAYDAYADALDAMGVDPKPVC